MIRAKANITRLVLSLMIKSQSIASRLSRSLVEEAPRQYTPRRLNAHHSRPFPLIGDNYGIKPSILKMIPIPLAGDVVRIHAVMRKIADRMHLPSSKLVHIVA